MNDGTGLGTGLGIDVLGLFADRATVALTEAREEIDQLNVFPVPDGDTGTNMLLTMSAARDALREAIDAGEDDDSVVASFCRGALLGARGNSGVILAEMVGAMVAQIVDPPAGVSEAEALALSLTAAADAAYAAVATPVEGTMLTVCRAAADAATQAAAPSTDAPPASVTSVAVAAAEAAATALEETPNQLQRLKDAGVVDAGGRGLTVLLDAVEAVLAGRVLQRRLLPTVERPQPAEEPRGRRQRPPKPPRQPKTIAQPQPYQPAVLKQAHSDATPHPEGDLTADGPAYEVMYLLDAEAEAMPALRQNLSSMGDSLVVTGRAGLFHVHIHTDDVGAAIEAGIEAGTPHRIRVMHFAQQVALANGTQGATKTSRRRPRVGRAVVAVAAGKGLENLFRESQAETVRTGPGRRPSVGQILKAIERTGAAEVVVLPNDPDTLRVAQVAAAAAHDEHNIRVEVIPTQAQVQGLAAVAVHDTTRAFERDVLAMAAAGSHARQGAITIAAKQAITTAGTCNTGDVLGAVEGDFAVIGDSMDHVAIAVTSRLLGAGGELVTLVTGEDKAAPAVALHLIGWLAENHPGVEVVIVGGDQARYPLLIGVE